jgi:hypothetical protein
MGLWMTEVKGLCDKRLTKGLIKVDHFPHNRPNVWNRAVTNDTPAILHR